MELEVMMMGVRGVWCLAGSLLWWAALGFMCIGMVGGSCGVVRMSRDGSG